MYTIFSQSNPKKKPSLRSFYLTIFWLKGIAQELLAIFIQSRFDQINSSSILSQNNVKLFIFLPQRAKRAEGTFSTLTSFSTLTEPKTTTGYLENKKKLLKNCTTSNLYAVRTGFELRRVKKLLHVNCLTSFLDFFLTMLITSAVFAWRS